MFERFLVYAVVTRPRLPPGRGEYPADEWRRLLGTGRVLAVSPPLRVRRTIALQPGQDGASIAIERINTSEVTGAGEMQVRQTSFIEGTVGGLSLASHQVAVYTREATPGALWRRLGIGLSTDARRWQLLPSHLGPVDKRIILVAVRYQGQPPDLNREQDTRFIVAQSALVRAVVTEPPLEITHVDGRALAADVGSRSEAPLSVGRVCRVEGTKLDGRAQDVAVYIRPTRAPDQWTRLALINEVPGVRWQTADLALPPPGDYVLTALSGEAAAGARVLPTGPSVRLSRPLYIKVEER